MSSSPAADFTHRRANKSNPGATSAKQFLQFSWLTIGSMTFSRSLLSRRRQVEILSAIVGIYFPGAHPRRVRCPVYFLGNGRNIRSPSQSGWAIPERYARSDSTDEFTRRLL